MSNTRSTTHGAHLKALVIMALGLAILAVVAFPALAMAVPTTTDNALATYNNTAVISLTATPGAGGTYKYTAYTFDAGALTTVAAWPASATVSLTATNISMIGNHTLTYFSVDTSTSAEATLGQQVGASVVKTFAIANLYPSTVALGVSSSYDDSATITLSGIAAVGGLPVGSTWFSLDGAPAVSGTTVTVTTAGSHSLTYWSKDTAGNAGFSTTVPFTVIDTIRPVVSSNAVGPYSGSASITLTGSDASGIASIWYSLDGGAWTQGTVVSVTAAGGHSLSFYAVDGTGLASLVQTAAFTVNAVDSTAPVTAYTGPANGASLAAGSVAHITLTTVDGGSGVAGLHYTVDGNAHVQNRVRAAAAFSGPNLGVPTSHPGGTAAAMTTANASCVAAGCHAGWALPTAGTISHAGIVAGCTTCHTFVSAGPIVEPADHATHDPSVSCNLCHGTSLIPAVMPVDNGGNHFLGSDPNGGSTCTDCHAYTIQSVTPPPSTASTVTVSFDVSGAGSHTILYWAVDKAGNTETQHSVTFTILTPVVNPIATSLSIGASPTSVKLPKPFVLSGLLTGAPVNGLTVNVMVKKPGKTTYSYSSARLTFGAAGSASSWWYRYTPTLKGTYTFYVTFAGNATYAASSTQLSPITVTVK